MPLCNRFFHANTEYNTYQKHIAAPMVRHTFKACPGKTVIRVATPNFYRLFLNGKDITRGELAPYIANPDHYVFEDDYDVSDLLSEGDNAVGLILGNGILNGDTPYWDFRDNVFRSAPKFAFVLETDQVEQFDASAFVWMPSAYYFDDLRSGVFYDATREIDGWCEPGFDDSDWHPVTAAERVRGAIRQKVSPDVTVYREVIPCDIHAVKLHPNYRDEGQHDLGGPYAEADQEQSGFLFDFGINTAAIFRLCVQGKRGQKISMQFCELLDEQGRPCYDNLGYYPDGYVQRDIYICKGEETEVFVPTFTYHGYRYCYVSGITEKQATPELLTMLMISEDMAQTGHFACSDEIVNQLQSMILNSDRSNFVHFPTDCPHREKHGWTGDAVVSAEQMLLNFDVVSAWREWLCQIRAAQTECGAIPGIVPTDHWGLEWGSGPIWDNVLFELPYLVYQYRGDDALIRENASAMLRYLQYADSKHRADGLLSYGLGDWAQVDMRSDDYAGTLEPKAPRCFVDTCAIYDACKKAGEMFAAVSMKKEQVYAETMAEELLSCLRRRCIDHGTTTALGRCQTSQAIAIALGIFEPAELANAGAVLVEIIREDGNRLDCGFYGMRYLFHALSLTGHHELAYQLMMRKEKPSYRWFVDQGRTSMPESLAEKGFGSQNHHFLGDVSHWFYRQIAGICINPYLTDPNTVIIEPKLLDELSFVEASVTLPKGKLSMRWEKMTENELCVTVSAAEGITVQFYAPLGYQVDCKQSEFVDEKRFLEDVPAVLKLRKYNQG